MRTSSCCVDPAGAAWLAHYLGRARARRARATAIEGFHLDQYGWPKFARRAVMARRSISRRASRFSCTRCASGCPRPRSCSTTSTTSRPTPPRGPARARTYIEVWPPHSAPAGSCAARRVRASTAARASAHPLGVPHVLRAGRGGRYGTPPSSVMAALFSNGAGHLLLGEDQHALTRPYYPTPPPAERSGSRGVRALVRLPGAVRRAALRPARRST